MNGRILPSYPSSLQSVLDDFGVTVVEPKVTRSPRQTHAAGTIRALWDGGQGEDHLRDVLTCILESENNAMALVRPVIGATSDLLLAHPYWWMRDASTWLEVYDRTNLMVLYQLAAPNKHAVAPRAAIAHDMFRRLASRYEPAFANLFGEDPDL